MKITTWYILICIPCFILSFFISVIVLIGIFYFTSIANEKPCQGILFLRSIMYCSIYSAIAESLMWNTIIFSFLFIFLMIICGCLFCVELINEQLRMIYYLLPSLFTNKRYIAETCVICLENKSSILHLPCKHMVVCNVCNEGINNCCMCRAPIIININY